MCIITVLKSHQCGLGPAPAHTPDSGTRFCLFGMHCAQMHHTHLLYIDGQDEICPGCDVRAVLQVVLWSLDTTATTPTPSLTTPSPSSLSLSLSGLSLEPTIPDPFYWESRKPPLTVCISLWNETAQRELSWLLAREDVRKMVHCKFILHYILGLPYFIQREPLLKIFGESVGSWCGYEGGLELKRIAREHFWDGELETALDVGFKRELEEIARAQERGGSGSGRGEGRGRGRGRGR